MDSQQAQGAGANSSSDFVRKLYKMLEDPSYESVVRWGNEGDSFVVLENEKFTKSILPKHFKHSNFASFVRQLNKYDFHKVRHNNEENGQSPYGVGAWEFKHPDFKANNKDALDNIRRKAPVPKKPNAPEDMPAQQMDLVNTQLGATQAQLQQLHDRYLELSQHHSMLLQEVIGLQKTVVNHEHVIQNVMNFLHSVDAQRRSSKSFPNPFANSGPVANGNPVGSAQETPPMDEPPASPLQHASKLLNEVNAETTINAKNLEQMNEMAHRMNSNLSTPPPSEAAFKSSQRSQNRDPPLSASSTGTVRYNDIENLVYPVGSNQGIDPMYGDHVHNIPYPMPQPNKPIEPSDIRAPQPPPSKKQSYDLGWVRQPQILLVEDDPTCRRIGGKFLYAFKCAIDMALDGLEAVNKLNSGSSYDLILMDIIMPVLDGVSACHLVRQFDTTPIIAMTSNIRSDDISMYFQHGMNDVLPKPFTKEGLMAMLDKHLGHLKRSSGGGPMSHSSARSLKDEEDTPGKSPTTMGTNWNSPAHMSGVSPVTSNIGEGYMPNPYGMEGGMPPPYGSGPHTPSAARMPPAPAGHRRHISDISGGEGDPSADVKRQQMYAPNMTIHGDLLLGEAKPPRTSSKAGDDTFGDEEPTDWLPWRTSQTSTSSEMKSMSGRVSDDVDWPGAVGTTWVIDDFSLDTWGRSSHKQQ
ncbi:MAG: hypothetical protein Q9162_004296 [Coniocarpon cinnabarinum]